MKLLKIRGRLMLPSAIAAVVMLMVLLWVLRWVFFLDIGELDDFLAYHWPMALFLFGLWGVRFILFIALIALIGCFLFVVRDVYIHGVAKKHGRITIVARVLGALGASAAFIGFLAWPLFPMGILISLMAVRGVKLALARPKVAGVWMLLAGILPWIIAPLLWVLGRIFIGLGFRSGDLPIIVLFLIGGSIVYLRPATLFLISGGVAALLSARKKRRQEKLASMSKG